MNIKTKTVSVKPWYRHSMLWLVIAVPITGVISTSTLIIFANLYKDGLVVDDYYKKGRAINQVLIREQYAKNANISAKISIQSGRNILVSLKSSKNINRDGLTLKLIDILKPQLDQTIILQPLKGGMYSGKVKMFHKGEWYIELGNLQWRLLERVFICRDCNFMLNFTKNQKK